MYARNAAMFTTDKTLSGATNAMIRVRLSCDGVVDVRAITLISHRLGNCAKLNSLATSRFTLAQTRGLNGKWWSDRRGNTKLILCVTDIPVVSIERVPPARSSAPPGLDAQVPQNDSRPATSLC